MGAGVTAHEEAHKPTRSIPTVGMRGGLGRTLLTAFLLLTILPLALIGGYAVEQNNHNVEREATAKLLAIASLKGEMLLRTANDFEALMIYPLSSAHSAMPNDYDAWWLSLNRRIPGYLGAVVTDSAQNIVWSTGECQSESTIIPRSSQGVTTDLQLVIQPAQSTGRILVTNSGQTIALCFDQSSVNYLMQSQIDLGETGAISLVVDSVLWPSGQQSIAGSLMIPSDSVFSGMYTDEAGIDYIAAYIPLPWDGVAIQVVQEAAEAIKRSDRITATLIALILSVALGTTVIAAFVIRKITRPVINLTESALAMADGDLNQSLEVQSRDEIGILTHVFNEMAIDLKSLYEDLEAKVVERTQRLQRANYQIQRRAIHLQASQEVSQAITSVRDPEQLLTRVVEVIRDRFVYSAVAIYIIPPAGGIAQLKAVSPRASDMRTTDADSFQTWPVEYHRGDGSLVDQAMRTGDIQIDRKESPEATGWYQRISCRVAIPLKMADHLIGMIGVDTAALDGVQDDELEILEVLGNQVTIALENARVYERERLAIEQLEAAEAFKSRFLGNMSHELREPLNTVIGFSRLLMKEVEGPLNAQQHQDIEQIYADSQQLMLLINDILAISQIQAGLMELKLQPVVLSEIVDGVMPTAGALVRGKDIALDQQIAEDLPTLCADPTRLRQIIIHLLNNAAKFTNRGWIKLRAWQHETFVFVSIQDTGIGIPLTDRERIFAQFERGIRGTESEKGTGLGLALCKEFVELHGGKIWVDSEVGTGSTFTFSIPVYAHSEICDTQLSHDE